MLRCVEHQLESIGLGKYAVPSSDTDVGLDIVAQLDQADLKDLRIALGHCKRLRKAIATLSAEGATHGYLSRHRPSPRLLRPPRLSAGY